MKKLIIFLVICLVAFTLQIFAQDKSVQEPQPVSKDKVYKDSTLNNGNKVTIYLGSKGGKWYYKLSGKSGKWYKVYLPKSK